jgi:hypothetical protein
MKARSCLWLLPVALGWAGATEPKPRPRLEPTIGSELKRDATQPAPADGRVWSFDDFLQAGARRAVGLDVYREPRATPAKAEDAEKTSKAAQDLGTPSPEAVTTSGDVLILPKIEITAQRLTKLREKLAALEANQSWESSSAEVWDKKTAVDAFLNPSWLRLGPYSAEASAAAARQRVEALRWVRLLTLALWEAKTPEDRARIQADIDEITGIMRFWQ